MGEVLCAGSKRGARGSSMFITGIALRCRDTGYYTYTASLFYYSRRVTPDACFADTAERRAHCPHTPCSPFIATQRWLRHMPDESAFVFLIQH